MSLPRRKTNPGHPALAPVQAARPYDRLLLLPRLIGLWPSEIQDYSEAGTLKILGSCVRRCDRSGRVAVRAIGPMI